MTMLLLIGVALGAVTIIPPGPVSVTLVQVGMTTGRGGGVRAGAGVAAADVVAGAAAVAALALGAATLGDAVLLARPVGAIAMATMGVALALRPQACEALVHRLGRPGRALFAMTMLNPMTFLSWTALIAAVPTAVDVGERAALAGGVMLASWCWHPLLGAAAGRFGAALSQRSTRLITRASGLLLMTVGVAFAVV